MVNREEKPMTANVETMAYANETPWHGLGHKVGSDVTPEQMELVAGLDWKVNKVPFTNPVTNEQSKDFFVLVRDKDGKELTPCGHNYVPVQNRQALQFFKKFTESGHMTLETAGSLDGGRRIFVLAKTTQSFAIKGKDKVDSYLFCYHPHIWGQSLKIMWTPIRVVCQNTLMQALHGKSAEFRMPHIQEFDANVQFKAEEALGLSQIKMREFQEQSELLASKEYNDKDLWKYWIALFQPSLKNEPNPTPEMFSKTLEYLNQVIHTQPGAQYSRNTWWQALNAVTYYIDHKSGRERDATLTSAWLGQKAALKRRALESALQYAA